MSEKKGLPLQAWLIIGIPILGVLLMYLSFPDSQQERDELVEMLGTTNHGELIYPAIDTAGQEIVLEDGSLLAFGTENSRWKFIIFDDGNCMDACRKSLFITGQIHKLIPKRSKRIERIYISPNKPDAELMAELKKEDPALLFAQSELASAIEHEQAMPQREDAYYLMDSKGQIIMYYHSDHDYKRIIKDLKVLL
jgi:hypothetical protein